MIPVSTYGAGYVSPSFEVAHARMGAARAIFWATYDVPYMRLTTHYVLILADLVHRHIVGPVGDALQYSSASAFVSALFVSL